jgi:hypothetical protein
MAISWALSTTCRNPSRASRDGLGVDGRVGGLNEDAKEDCCECPAGTEGIEGIPDSI